MPNETLDDIVSIPAEKLAEVSKVQVEIVPDLDALYRHFARSIADEIKAHNAAGSPTRLILPVGPAHFTIAPVARLDVAFTALDNVGRDDADEVNVEFELGGMVNWHLPLRKHLDFIVGVGLLASILSNRTEVYVRRGQQEAAVPASALRMLWTAGVGWSPLKK